MEHQDIIPEHKTGSKTDIVATKELSSIEEAKQFFKECKSRLFNINGWSHLSGVGSADFKLTDKDGKEVKRQNAEVGDLFKIDIPGPGTVTGHGYDWVRIESIEDRSGESEENEVVAIRVRPASNPENNKQDVAHFFTDEATSNFIVTRRGNVITAEVHGRNEKPNTDAEAAIDKTRNTMVALGAMAGFSEVKWTKLVNGIIGK